jgi:hypothetical protein
MGNFSSVFRNNFRTSYNSNSVTEPLLQNQREEESITETETEKEISEHNVSIFTKIAKLESDINNLIYNQKSLKEHLDFLTEKNNKYEKDIIKLTHNQTILSEILSLEQYRI